jgi:hypothetical protein
LRANVVGEEGWKRAVVRGNGIGIGIGKVVIGGHATTI